jgi:hypothetical protein
MVDNLINYCNLSLILDYFLLLAMSQIVVIAGLDVAAREAVLRAKRLDTDDSV